MTSSKSITSVAGTAELPSPITRLYWKTRYHFERATDRFREAFFPWKVSLLSGDASTKASTDELIVVCLVRNGAAYVPEFLRHYRELGAKHIVFLDNGSADETVPMASANADVTVFRTVAPYKIYKDIMKRWLVERFGRSNWVLCVDVDELFDYPYRGSLNLKGFLTYLNSQDYTAVVGQLLDMFPEGVIANSAETGWRGQHRFYSLRDLERVSYDSFYKGSNAAPPVALEVLHGGIRGTAFDARVLLTKHPLLFPSAGLNYLHAHHVKGARVADVSAVLLHYKYVGDFAGFVKTIVEEESYSTNSREYKNYKRVMDENPDLKLHSQDSLEFRSVETLLDQGFVVASGRFREVAGNASGSRT
jgi:hypothetical protein